MFSFVFNFNKRKIHLCAYVDGVEWSVGFRVANLRVVIPLIQNALCVSQLHSRLRFGCCDAGVEQYTNFCCFGILLSGAGI